MAPPRGEPEYGMGSAANAATVSAGFKIETKSIDTLISKFERLLNVVKDFNKELGKINGAALDRLGGGGGPRAAGSGMLSAGGFSLPPGAGRTPSGLILPNGGIPPVQPPVGGGAAAPSGNGGHGLSRGQVGLGLALGAGYAMTSYMQRHRGDMAGMERFAQVQSWGTAGNTNANMGAFRHQMAGQTGYTSNEDLLAGNYALRGMFGYGNTAQFQQRQQGASMFGNVLGSYEQGAQATAGLYSPQAYYNLMSLGVQTRGPGGQMRGESDVTRQLLTSIYGGRLPTTSQLQAGSAQGSNLQATLNSLGLDQATRDAIMQTGMLQSKSGWNLSDEDVRNYGGSKAGKDAFGNSLYDQQRDQARAQAKAMEELADGALPAMKAAVEATTDALYTMSNSMGGVLAAMGVAGGASTALSPITSTISGVAQSALGYALAPKLMEQFGRMRGRGTPPVPGAGGAAGASSGLLRGLGIAGAGAAGGALVNTAVGGRQGSGRDIAGGVIGGGLAGAGIGAALAGIPTLGFGAPIGAAVGGAIGGIAGGLFEGLGGPGDGFTAAALTPTINRSEAEVLSAGPTAGGSAPGAQQDTTSDVGTSQGGAATAGGNAMVGGVTDRGRKALAWMERESRNPTQSWDNWCLKAVRTSLGVPGGAPDASTAWGNTKIRRGTGNPPPGVPVWWTGGHGHVALSAGGGKVWSNDIRRKGGIDLVTIDEINRKWGKPYHGWTEDINGVDVYDGDAAASAAGASTAGSAGMSSEAAKNYARGRLQAFGWGGDQWSALEQLWMGESDWNYKAANPTSSARGIPQAMMSAHFGGKNWANNAGAQKYMNDARVQIDWGLNYIKGRYGSPGKAWSSWQSRSPHWYAEGGIATGPRMIGVGERGPEAVIPLNGKGVDTLAEAFKRAQRETRRGNDTSRTATQVRERAQVNVTLNMPIQMARGTQADAERLVDMVVRRIESDDRLAAVMGGDN